MQDFSTVHRMLDYVDKLPDNLPFDYHNPECCVYGLARAYMPEYTNLAQMKGVDKLSCDQLQAYQGLSSSQFNALYGGVTHRVVDRSGNASPYSVDPYDRHEIIEAMRRMLAKWEADQALAHAKRGEVLTFLDSLDYTEMTV